MDNKDRLIAQEWGRVERLIDKHTTPGYLLGFTARDYVAKCYEAHADLIESWGAWRVHYDVDVPNVASVDQVRDLFRKAASAVVDASDGPDPFTGTEWQWTRTGQIPVRPMEPAFKGRTADEDLPATAWLRLPAMIRPGAMWRADYTTTQTDEELVECLRAWLACRQETGLAKADAVDVRKGQKIFGPILRAVEKWAEPLTPEQRARCVDVWNRFAGMSGEIWSNAGRTMGVTFSCAPSSFLKLGHYGEVNSCYSFGSSHYPTAKRMLSARPDTVVGLFYKLWEDEDPTARAASHHADGSPRPGKVSGRLWGYMSPDEPGAVLGNLYRLTWAEATGVLSSALQAHWGEDARINVYETNSALQAGGTFAGMYSNDDGRRFTSANMDETGWNTAALTEAGRKLQGLADNHLAFAADGQECATCERWDEDLHWCDTCAHSVCPDCIFWSRVDGSIICRDCRDEYTFCEGCDKYHHHEAGACCEDCGVWFCDDCGVTEHCDDCGGVFCEDCTTEHEANEHEANETEAA